MNLLLLPAILGGIALVLLLLAVFTRRKTRRIEALVPPVGSFVEVDGVRLHVRDEGCGPAIVMIHGLAGQMAHFDYGAVRALSRRYRVVTLDRPGSGYSTRPDGVPADPGTQARTIAAMMDRLGLERPTVVAHSLGGAVALTLALDYPGQVGALALISPLSHKPQSVPPMFRTLTIETDWLRRLIAATLALPLAILATPWVLRRVFGPEAPPSDFATHGGGLLSLRPRQFLAGSADVQALPGHMQRIEKRYRELRMPVQVMFGRQDEVLDWRANGQALVDQLPGARLELVDGGHMLQVTQPERTARFIEGVVAARLALAS